MSEKSFWQRLVEKDPNEISGLPNVIIYGLWACFIIGIASFSLGVVISIRHAPTAECFLRFQIINPTNPLVTVGIVLVLTWFIAFVASAISVGIEGSKKLREAKS